MSSAVIWLPFILNLLQTKLLIRRSKQFLQLAIQNSAKQANILFRKKIECKDSPIINDDNTDSYACFVVYDATNRLLSVHFVILIHVSDKKFSSTLYVRDIIGVKSLLL
jgi:hypothetical protein